MVAPPIGEELRQPAVLGHQTGTVGMPNRSAPKTVLASPGLVLVAGFNSGNTQLQMLRTMAYVRNKSSTWHDLRARGIPSKVFGECVNDILVVFS